VRFEIVLCFLFALSNIREDWRGSAVPTAGPAERSMLSTPYACNNVMLTTTQDGSTTFTVFQYALIKLMLMSVLHAQLNFCTFQSVLQETAAVLPVFKPAFVVF
jgi:hypothetical protein